MTFVDQLVAMFKSDMMSAVDYKRFVRYFYDPPPKFDEDSAAPIWLLGQEYQLTPAQHITTTDREDVVEIASSIESHELSETGTSHTTALEQDMPKDDASRISLDDVHNIEGQDIPSVSNDPADGGWPLAFIDDFESRIWMTYRSNFPPIPRSQDPISTSSMTFAVRLRSLADREGFTSDTGWGCMIRSGQSVLANALLLRRYGRAWRYQRKPTEVAPTADAETISLFADHPSAPFSIHNFVSHGAAACNTHPGHWFGPSTTAACIAALVEKHLAARLRVYVSASTADVYEDKLRALSTGPAMQPTLILLGVRLGPDRITPVYHPALRDLFTYPQSLGIAGGRPSSSHYFVGVHSDTFFYLDPHTTQNALPYHPSPSEYTESEVASCHTRRLRGVKVGEMDPSMLLAFLVNDEEDWKDFRRRIDNATGKGIVHVHDRSPPVPGVSDERAEAVDEVETFDDEEDEEKATKIESDQRTH